ncbi:pseudouridine synthase [Alicyclobacillus ferrooxydans]|uniref:Pseudouridine synthase n=1 Tax=Alicyclobacillus ferrooxydans TaxID=471514 RepID=A0A0P9GRP9_9BACL|nr:pseudouridine synthase [Alicyclobacillus ferrooxydans]KPV43679.1 pseudouridine synthase [Alicyclobacillus ferrooxydans]
MSEKSMRLDRLLGNMGLGTRKDIKEMARQGRVFVNGTPVRDTSIHVTPSTDLVEVDGERVVYREHIYLMMNKPAGLVSATEDAREETVVSLLEPEDQAFNPFPVGRLDKDTEGLLILTNDGQLTHELLSPKRHVPKTYYAKVLGEVNDSDVEAFSEGVTLDDGYECLPGELTILQRDEPYSQIELTIFEGKFHQVKRMFEAVGKKVIYLQRIRMGALELDNDLPTGTYRELTDEELQLLRQR